LFDSRTEFSLLRWPEADRQAETLADYFKDYPQILAWSLKHEPDRDYESSSPELVDAWLRHIAQTVRRVDPSHLLTITWGDARAASRLADVVDFISFDFLGSVVELRTDVRLLRLAAAKKPIVASGLAASTWRSFLFPSLGSDKHQAAYYSAILSALRDEGCAGAVTGSLYDSDYVPRRVSGWVPWTAASKRHLGLLRSDGSKKPAADLVRAGFRPTVGRPGILALLVQPFSATVAAVVILLAAFSFSPARQALSRLRFPRRR